VNAIELCSDGSARQPDVGITKREELFPGRGCRRSGREEFTCGAQRRHTRQTLQHSSSRQSSLSSHAIPEFHELEFATGRPPWRMNYFPKIRTISM